MRNIGYMIDRILSMNILGIFDVANKVHKKTKRNRFVLVIDIIWCGLRHMAGYVDYYVFEMYNLNEHQRKTVMTSGRNNAFIRELNNPKFKYIFESKKIFHTQFSDLIKREWLSLEDSSFTEFSMFIENRKDILAKSNTVMGSCCNEIITISDFDDIYTLWYYLQDMKCTIIEDPINQHPKMQQLQPDSLNLIRFVTIFLDEKVHIVRAYLRIGQSRSFNGFDGGKMVVPIDIKTGIIHDVAVDKAGHFYRQHPVTETSIQGFQIPFWNECLELVEQAASRTEQVRLVGWDIGLSVDGPHLIEGNQFPCHDIYQLPLHTPKKIGMVPEFQEIIKSK